MFLVHTTPHSTTHYLSFFFQLHTQIAREQFLMAALCKRACHYIFALWFLLSFFSSPNFSDRRLDVYHTSTHGVALVRIWNAGVKYAARGWLEMQDPKKLQKFAIWTPSHNFVGLYLRN